ncbi:hypothetical protein [Amycolatopsis taiwanensis]|uniref:Uncharacterized protein n=1 Tax=Amycolatopsis taiwanensis TaxID=342230 RepID=A0A9W6R266_9PSEU|nr:hypothetical protein [Amycolatopsis taiwanensis]GLY67784.1 hypothetical protein Atai01_44030 [Amycolatopsis taiwanensis]
MSEMDRQRESIRAAREARAGAASRAASGHGTGRLAGPAISPFILAEERRREDEFERELRLRKEHAEREARKAREKLEYLEKHLNPRGDRR